MEQASIGRQEWPKLRFAFTKFIYIAVVFWAFLPHSAFAQGSTQTQLVQTAACPSSTGAEAPISSTPDYYCPLPEPATQGNTVALEFSADNTNTPTLTVKDDKNDAFTIACSTLDANGNRFFLAYFIGVTAGARVIDIHGSAMTNGYWTPHIAEFTGVTAFDVCQSNSTANSTKVAGASITPAGAGELLTQWAVSGTHTLQSSTFTVGSQSNIVWQFAYQSVYDAYAMQYGIYNANTAIGPTFTAANADSWDIVEAFFKTGTAGGIPTQAFRVDHILHLNVMGGWDIRPLQAGFPSSGNLVVIKQYGSNGGCITGVTSVPSNTWTEVGGAGFCFNGGNATTYENTWYCADCTTSNGMTLTITTSATSDLTMMIYDVLGAASSDVFDRTSGGQSSGDGSQVVTSLTTCSACITPAGANEIVFSAGGWDNNTASGMSSPSGGLFDSAYFTGNSYNGPETVDQNNQASHYYTTGSAPLTFTWNILHAPSTSPGSWSDLEDAFRGASGISMIPAPPTGLTAIVQ